LATTPLTGGPQIAVVKTQKYYLALSRKSFAAPEVSNLRTLVSGRIPPHDLQYGVCERLRLLDIEVQRCQSDAPGQHPGDLRQKHSREWCVAMNAFPEGGLLVRLR
jgi:hypothetical protein